MRKLFVFSLIIIINSCCSKITKKNDYSFISIKRFIQSYNKNLEQSKIDNIILYVNKYSIENDIDPKIIFSLIAKESSFRDNIVSKSGAIGLGQLLHSTARDLGINNPFDIEENIKGTVKYLKKMLILSNNNLDLAIASYKMGYYSVNKIINSGNNLPDHTINYINDIKNEYQRIAID